MRAYKVDHLLDALGVPQIPFRRCLRVLQTVFRHQEDHPGQRRPHLKLIARGLARPELCNVLQLSQRLLFPHGPAQDRDAPALRRTEHRAQIFLPEHAAGCPAHHRRVEHDGDLVNEPVFFHGPVAVQHAGAHKQRLPGLQPKAFAIGHAQQAAFRHIVDLHFVVPVPRHRAAPLIRLPVPWAPDLHRELRCAHPDDLFSVITYHDLPQTIFIHHDDFLLLIEMFSPNSFPLLVI